MTNPDDQFDELMRRSLHDEAEQVQPADGLHQIQARVRDQHKPAVRRPWLLTAGAAVVGTAAAIGAFTMLGNDGPATKDAEVAGPADSTKTVTGPVPASQLPTAAPATPEPTLAPTEAPKVAPTPRGKVEQVTSKAVPVYWLGKTAGVDTGAGVRLYRTWAQIKGRPAYEALRLMTSGKSVDPDYSSPWQGSAVSSVTRADGLITVDFKVLPRQQLAPAVANMAAQQLVYTVQGAMDVTGPVQVTVQGEPVTRLFGVDTAQPLSRAQALDVQAFIWVTYPENGTIVRAPLKVSGIAAAHEASLNYRITANKTGQLIAEGSTQTTEAYKLTPYSFTVTKLPAGEYTLEIFEISMEDGRQTSTDTKTFYVR
ncbi:sporulation and spore germination protein [Kribbella sp. VKM Ac-2527]|uniref:Sporulation and spore germination protein n=1 Tax=Kribbella caucasensis TaxID=2512215 RepID=A0A4R6K5R1_9ACTN|nr:Gmad2 immunoglobulin-like domain-containing protein [Kribbella sp. VKM Ac-2527]TDO44693.1 sporulation and spore germination protein [Kribbella sp. VKM Ac-2527]